MQNKFYVKFLLLVVLMLFCNYIAKPSPTYPFHYRFLQHYCEENGKWGYILNYHNKIIRDNIEIVIECKYDSVPRWTKDYIFVKVQLDGKWGYIDTTGKEFIPVIFDEVSSFNNGCVRVKLDNKFGLMDITGKEITPIIYDDIKGFKDGLAVVRLTDKYGYIDTTGKVVFPVIYESAEDYKNGKLRIRLNREFFCLDIDGNKIECLNIEEMEWEINIIPTPIYNEED